MSAILLLAAALAASPAVDVRVLARLAPASVELAGTRSHAVEVSGEHLLVDGQLREGLELPAGTWRVTLRSCAGSGRSPLACAGERRYEGALRIHAERDELAIVVQMPVESYVAATVASETLPGTPAAALRAQAIVARSYALAARRHQGHDLCDLAHCQVLAGQGDPSHLAAAAAAAARTRGLVLWTGATIAGATFHAECAGHTADPVEIFGAPDRTGAAAVGDAGCGAPWTATLTAAQVDEALSSVLGGPARLADVEPLRGRGGYLVRVRDRRSGRAAAGDAFVRALGASAGWSAVRGGRLAWKREGDLVHLRGHGAGHGVGLCQAGADRLARAGRSHEAILATYFPRASIAAAAGSRRREGEPSTAGE